MSTKIYHAWRCRCRSFPGALKQLRMVAFAHAAKTVRDEIRKFDKVRFEAEYKKFLKEKKQPKDTRTLRRIFQVRAVFSLAQDASRSPERMNPCDIDASLNVWVHKARVYIIGYGDVWNTYHDFVPTWAEDYSWWNNVDKPADVGTQAWRRRGENWNAVLDSGWDTARLTHRMIEAKDDVGLHELSEMLLPKINSMMVVP